MNRFFQNMRILKIIMESLMEKSGERLLDLFDRLVHLN